MGQLASCLTAIFCTTVLFFATPGTAAAQSSANIPREDLFRLFLQTVDHLDKEANNLQARGKPKDAQELRYYESDHAGLTLAQGNTLLQAAAGFRTAMEALDTRASAEMQAARARFAINPNSTPSVESERTRLRDERSALVASKINSLGLALGESGMAKLEAYLRRDFSRNIKPLTMSPDQLPAPMREAMQGVRKK